MAISSSILSEWRWRILDYSGAILEESRERFATISAAVAAGTEQLIRMNVTERADAFAPRWHARRARGV